MYATPTLATRFASNTRVLRSEVPLSEEQMRQAAPSIFAEGKHASRSERYTYIPTIDVLRGLQREGFEPFMVAQGAQPHRRQDRVHQAHDPHAARREPKPWPPGPKRNEIILINSHDGASSYQLLAGLFRFVCCNGLVVGDVVHDIRIPHKGDVQGEVIEGAFRVLDDFEAVDAVDRGDEGDRAEARGGEGVRHAPRWRCATASAREGQPPAPITAEQLMRGAPAARMSGNSLWTTFQRVQEHVIRGGLPGRTVQGRRMRTREVASIDRNVSLNRALWVLAEEMRRLKT